MRDFTGSVVFGYVGRLGRCGFNGLEEWPSPAVACQPTLCMTTDGQFRGHDIPGVHMHHPSVGRGSRGHSNPGGE